MKIENLKIGGMQGYVQCASPDRWSPPDAEGWMTSTVCAGDRWQPGGDTSDDKKFSERCEFRSLDEDTVGDGRVYWYEAELLIPVDYPEMSPKSTLLQWHDGSYPPAFVRYENQVLEFVLNYESGLNLRANIPSTKGVPVRLEFGFVWTPGPNAGRVVALADGKLIVDEKNISLVEESAKSIYSKCGIYRSGMNRYAGPKPAPSQSVRHRNMTRSVHGTADTPARFLGASTPALVPTPAPVLAPAASTPTPAPAVSTVAVRIARIQAELSDLAADVVPASAATLVSQAGEKLAKAGAQIAKAAGKTIW